MTFTVTLSRQKPKGDTARWKWPLSSTVSGCLQGEVLKVSIFYLVWFSKTDNPQIWISNGHLLCSSRRRLWLSVVRNIPTDAPIGINMCGKSEAKQEYRTKDSLGQLQSSEQIRVVPQRLPSWAAVARPPPSWIRNLVGIGCSRERCYLGWADFMCLRQSLENWSDSEWHLLGTITGDTEHNCYCQATKWLLDKQRLAYDHSRSSGGIDILLIT